MVLAKVVLFSGLCLAEAAVPAEVLWLPLGDSITFGCTGPTGDDCHNDAGSYRVPLAFALTQPPLGPPTNVGFNISTMGTLFTGPSYVPQQWLHHEGHPGWRIDTSDQNLDKALATSQRRPDLITIHLGTNDCDQGTWPNGLVTRMNSLLQHIYEKTPYSQVFLADVLDMADNQGARDCVKAFNPHVPDIVSSWASKGMSVTFVPLNKATGDMCGATGPEADLCGGHQIHPTSAGYPLMASAFALSIMQNFKPGPMPDHPATCSLVQEGETMEVGCSDGVINSVDFASWGQPSGSCSDGLQKSDSCHAASSQSIVENACLGKKFCRVIANSDSLGGDPCFGKPKNLAVQISCKSQQVV